jgi:hypothetical protein
MACRLVNLHKHPLRVDLRGGETLVLQPGQTSLTLYEELLYDNCHLPGWEKAGWIARLPVRLTAAKPAPKPPVLKPSALSPEAAPASPAPNAQANKSSREDAEAERLKPGARPEDKTSRGSPAKK